jgi:predicted small secreted protein
MIMHRSYEQGGYMFKKLWYRACVMVLVGLSLSGCGAVRGIGDALINGFKGFSIHFR